MTEDTIAGRLGGQPMAMDVARGREFMAMAYPGQPVDLGATMAGPVEVQRGERFAVARSVAVMPIRGVLTPDSAALERYLGWATYQGIEVACAELAANEDVAAVVLDVSCPGGMVRGLEAGAQAIAALAKAKPVHVLINPLAASAAYWLACQATDISATPGSETGCIGTMRQSVWPVGPDNWGDKWDIHLSSHARAKNPNPTEEYGLAEIQRSLDESEAHFLDAVAAGRGLERDGLALALSVTDDPADGGAVFKPAEAISRGLVDTEETRAAFYDRIFSVYAPKPAKPVQRAMSAKAKARAAKAISNT